MNEFLLCLPFPFWLLNNARGSEENREEQFDASSEYSILMDEIAGGNNETRKVGLLCISALEQFFFF